MLGWAKRESEIGLTASIDVSRWRGRVRKRMSKFTLRSIKIADDNCSSSETRESEALLILGQVAN
jgi:hypothetical protein